MARRFSIVTCDSQPLQSLDDLGHLPDFDSGCVQLTTTSIGHRLGLAAEILAVAFDQIEILLHEAVEFFPPIPVALELSPDLPGPFCPGVDRTRPRLPGDKRDSDERQQAGGRDSQWGPGSPRAPGNDRDQSELSELDAIRG